MKPIAALLLFCSCVATYSAGVRRMAEARLQSCRRGTSTLEQVRPCYTQTQDYCRAHGLERTCGEGSP